MVRIVRTGPAGFTTMAAFAWTRMMESQKVDIPWILFIAGPEHGGVMAAFCNAIRVS
ncbi:MAG: hypothetical protein AB1547_01255 [Thermodesulfobacteriota bacterium]